MSDILEKINQKLNEEVVEEAVDISKVVNLIKQEFSTTGLAHFVRAIAETAKKHAGGKSGVSFADPKMKDKLAKAADQLDKIQKRMFNI